MQRTKASPFSYISIGAVVDETECWKERHNAHAENKSLSFLVYFQWSWWMMRQNVAKSARERRDEWQYDIEQHESEGGHPKQAQAGGGAIHSE